MLPGEEPGKHRSDAQDIPVDARVHRRVVLVVGVEDPVEAAAGEGDLTLHEVDAELSREGGVLLQRISLSSIVAVFDKGISCLIASDHNRMQTWRA